MQFYVIALVAKATKYVQHIIQNILKKLGKQNHYDKVVSSYRTTVTENRIVSLDLIGLGINELYNDIFKEITEINQLYLSWNDFEILPDGVFDQLTSLRHLDLRGSGLIKLQTGIFDKLQNLQKLELNDNKLKKIPNHFFDKLTSIREINLSNNQIKSLDSQIFNNLGNLQSLYLYFNPLPGEISFGNYYDRESIEDLIAQLNSNILD